MYLKSYLDSSKTVDTFTRCFDLGIMFKKLGVRVFYEIFILMD